MSGSIPLSCIFRVFEAVLPLWQFPHLWLLSTICFARCHIVDCFPILNWLGCGGPFLIGITLIPCCSFIIGVGFPHSSIFMIGKFWVLPSLPIAVCSGLHALIWFIHSSRNRHTGLVTAVSLLLSLITPWVWTYAIYKFTASEEAVTSDDCKIPYCLEHRRSFPFGFL